jgi:YD repeat-containing protein
MTLVAAAFRLAKFAGCAALVALLHAIQADTAQAQSGPPPAPLILTRPVVDYLDENRVSIVSGKAQFTVPALKLGDVSFVPYSYNGQHFAKGGVADHNYGSIAQCQSIYPADNQYAGAFECTLGGGSGIQTIHGEERATFAFYGSGGYESYTDGSKFVDNGSTCTWTKPDGTQVVYVAYHDAGNPICKSNNISKIIYPDGRIATYYYYGSFSTTVWGWSPILSIVTNSGYMLKYNYSGTPKFGSETSVTAINRAFETCDPAALSCSLSNAWPTATLTFTDKIVPVSDGFPSISPTYSGTRHYLFTIEEASHRKHVFELDSYSRVISYQPPGATTPQYTYNLCSNLVGDGLRYCFGYTQWHHFQPFDVPPLLFDAVESVTRNGQTWEYSALFTTASLPYNSTWWRLAYDPRGGGRQAKGNSTPGTESLYGGPIKEMNLRDGTIIEFGYSVANPPVSVLTPAGIKTQYGYDGRLNLTSVTRNPVANSGQPVIVQSAIYPTTCTNMITCNKPTAVIDGKNNQTDFTYDPAHGGALTVTSPAVAGGRPETRYTYSQRRAWYLGSNGVMAADSNLIWVLATESLCAAGSGCTMVTTYDYGPDSGPNNLILRGKTVTADGQTQRVCYGHDKQGNTIWETSPKANASSCPDY